MQISIDGQEPQPLKDPTTIGRQKGRDIVIPLEVISKHHAKIYQDNGAWFIRDEQSTNGTFVNGDRISAPTKIIDGDVIRLNDSADIVIQDPSLYEDTAPGFGDLAQAVTLTGNRLHLLEQQVSGLADGIQALAERQEADERYKVCANEYNAKASQEMQALKLAGIQNIETTIKLKKAMISGIGLVIGALCLNTALSFSDTPEKRGDLVAAIASELRSEWGSQAMTFGLISFLGVAANSIKKNLAELNEQRPDTTIS